MSEEIFDLTEFLERVQDDKELLLELLEIYVSDYQEKRIQLEQAIQDQNYEEVRSITHSLKGASGNISAKILRQTFLDLEEMAKNEDLSEAANAFSEMDQQFQALTEEIEKVKKEYAA